MTTSVAGRWPAHFANAALVLALLSAVLIGGSVLGYRTGVFDLKLALVQMVPAGVLAGLLAILVILARVVVTLRTKARGGQAVAIIAFVIAVGVITLPLLAMKKATTSPRIHDISTDTVDPPTFVAVVPLRLGAVNSLEYGGPELAHKQSRAYPDIAPIIVPVSPDAAFAKAQDAAHALGWQIVAVMSEAGQIEATDTSRWFRFTDDIVIRVRPDVNGSRIDVRSVSRVGDGDLGANAARIRAFRDEIARR